METTIEDFEKTISKKAKEMQNNAAFGGSWNDGGASDLMNKLKYFLLGFSIGIQSDNNLIIKIPEEFEKYFMENDDEYKDYLRLKGKFEKITKNI